MLEPVDASRLAAGGVNVGIDQPGLDRVDADALVGNFFRQANRHRIDRALGCGVVDVLVGTADVGRARRQVDDGAAAAAVPGRHAPHRLARAQETADDVDVEHPAPALGIHVHQVALALEDAGIVDQPVEAAKLVVDSAVHRLDLGLDGDIGLKQNRPVAAGEQPVEQLVGRGFAVLVVEAQRITAGGGEARGFGADSAAGSGDQ